MVNSQSSATARFAIRRAARVKANHRGKGRLQECRRTAIRRSSEKGFDQQGREERVEKPTGPNCIRYSKFQLAARVVARIVRKQFTRRKGGLTTSLNLVFRSEG
jgi:hypothetical protein